MGAPCYILGITKAYRVKIGKQPGDTVEVTVEKDEEERIVQLPEDFKEMIESDIEVNEFWKSLSFSMQKKYATWITSAKKEETRKARVDKALEKLKNKEKNV